MAIVAGDLEIRLSGGAANSDPNASLGGAKSSTLMGVALNDLWDNVDSGEAAAGDVEYRCIYVHNDHATLALQNAKVWIEANTPAASTQIAIGLGSSAVNGTEQTVANESTAPAGVTFSEPSSGSPLNIGSIPAGQHKAVWVRRTVVAASPAITADGATLGFGGDTAA